MLNLLLPLAVAEEVADSVTETTGGTVSEAAEATVEAVAESAPTWSQELVKKFAETHFSIWIILFVVTALAVTFLVIRRSSKQWNAKVVAYGAICIALSFILSCFRLFRMPQGGSVTPGSMLPLMLFSACFGVGPGLLAGFTYGVLQYFQGGYFLNFWQFALDYLLAYTALGLAGLAKYFPQKWGLYAAMLIAVLARALSATLAGIMFWETAPVASLIYNGTYLIPDTVICILLSLLIGQRLMHVMKSGR